MFGHGISAISILPLARSPRDDCLENIFSDIRLTSENKYDKEKVLDGFLRAPLRRWAFDMCFRTAFKKTSGDVFGSAPSDLAGTFSSTLY